MDLTSASIVSVVGVIIPMMTIAGSAVAFVWKSFRDARQERKRAFFDLMTLIDAQGSIASKIAAVYQLRQFPEHKDFIVRFCDTQRENLKGEDTAVWLLADEMKKPETTSVNSFTDPSNPDCLPSSYCSHISRVKSCARRWASA